MRAPLHGSLTRINRLLLEALHSCKDRDVRGRCWRWLFPVTLLASGSCHSSGSATQSPSELTTLLVAAMETVDAILAQKWLRNVVRMSRESSAAAKQWMHQRTSREYLAAIKPRCPLLDHLQLCTRDIWTRSDLNAPPAWPSFHAKRKGAWAPGTRPEAARIVSRAEGNSLV